jgi:nucleotide-binding universal stress UspA family protein
MKSRPDSDRKRLEDAAEQALDVFAKEEARLTSIRPKGKAKNNPALYEWEGQWFDLQQAHRNRLRDDAIYNAAAQARSEKELQEARAEIEAKRARDVEFLIKHGQEEQAIEKHVIEAIDLAKRIPHWGKKRLLNLINEFWPDAGEDDE